jgi:hypothetical protein
MRSPIRPNTNTAECWLLQCSTIPAALRISGSGISRPLFPIHGVLRASVVSLQLVEQWLMRRTGDYGRGFERFTQEYLHDTLGLYRIPAAAPTCRERKSDGTGESWMPEIGTSSLMSGDCKRSYGANCDTGIGESCRQQSSLANLRPPRQSSTLLRNPCSWRHANWMCRKAAP